MSKYKIRYNELTKFWEVVWVKEKGNTYEIFRIDFSHKTISECYIWLKAKHEGLLIEE